MQSYELRGKQPFVSDFSRLLRHAIEKGRGPILYSKKTRDPTGRFSKDLVLQTHKNQGLFAKWLKTEILFGIGRQHCGKGRKCWSPAFFPLPTMFSKGFFFKVVQSQDYVVNEELTLLQNC